jgi:hypothetical protein
MAPELSRLVRQFTFALLLLAAAAAEVAAEDARSVPASVGTAVVWVGLAALLARLVPVPTEGRRSPPRLVFLILLALTAAPFFVEPLRREWAGEGYPLELQMVFALRNLGLGLAACAGWLLCLRLACVVSLFLMLFAVATNDHPAVLTLLGLYSAAGSVWLMLVYWTGLRRFFVASDTAVALEVQPGHEQLPWLAVFVAVGLVGCVLGAIAVGPRRAARVLGEWLPTSGGTGDYHPFARGGLNDGDDEVKGDNARSTGMTQSDSFLDSPDTFGGMAWQEAPAKGNAFLLDKEPNSCWMKVREQTPAPAFAGAESHQFKITSSPGTLVPTPPHLSRFRVGRVDQADFFAWGQDRILRMSQRKTPSGVVVETECRTVDPRLLGAIEFPGLVNGRPGYSALPPDLDPEVAALARRWADGHPTGWQQIAAVIGRLHSEYILDPTARVPDDCGDPLGHFLLHSRRGPDYQFAGAAAVLLRVLGYPDAVGQRLLRFAGPLRPAGPPHPCGAGRLALLGR